MIAPLFIQGITYNGAPLVAPTLRLDQAVMQIREGAFCTVSKAQSRVSPWDFQPRLEVSPTLAIYEGVPVDGGSERYAQHIVESFDRGDGVSKGSIGPTMPRLLDRLVDNRAAFRTAYPEVTDPRGALVALRLPLLVAEMARESMLAVIDGDSSWQPWGQAFVDRSDGDEKFNEQAVGPLIAAVQTARAGAPILVMNHYFEWATLEQTIPALEAHLA